VLKRTFSASEGVKPEKLHSWGFCSTFIVMSWKKYYRRQCVVKELVPIRGEKIQATPTKQNLGTSYKFFSKFTTSTPVLVIRENSLFPSIFLHSILLHAINWIYTCTGKHLN